MKKTIVLVALILSSSFSAKNVLSSETTTLENSVVIESKDERVGASVDQEG
jgi:hypothetical protein